MTWTADELMTVAAARELRDGMTCFVGIGLPSTAANLARTTHAPELVLIYESGTLGSRPDRLPLSIGDGVLASTADAVVSVPEVFNYWLQTGRIDVGFLGAAQLDRLGNINTTVIGDDYRLTKVWAPGAGGRRNRRYCREVIWSYATSSGPWSAGRLSHLGRLGKGPGERSGWGDGAGTRLVTPLGIRSRSGQCERT